MRFPSLLLFGSLLALASGHALCSSGLTPLAQNGVTFCTMYASPQQACCDAQLDGLVRSNVSSYGGVSAQCLQYLKNVTCASCDGWAAHLVGEEESTFNLNAVPILCTSYCTDLYAACANQIIANSPFSATRATARLDSLYPNAQAFCEEFGYNQTRDGNYCFDGVPFEEPPPPPFSGTVDGLCLHAVADVGANYYTMAFMPLPDNRALYATAEIVGANKNGKIVLLIPNRNTSGFDAAPTNYLTIPGVERDNEGGILGIAFHPDWANNGRFFVGYTPNAVTYIVAEYRANGNPLTSTTANPGEFRRIMTISQPGGNHNGGQLLVGPNDGFLYVFTGDGGGEAALQAQDLTKWMGKIHRISVDATGPSANYTIPSDNPFANSSSNAIKSVFALGLRNPWRNSFDRENGRLLIGDVGQERIEEVNVLPPFAPQPEKPFNFGWRKFEGTEDLSYRNDARPTAAEVTFPAFFYKHSDLVGSTSGCVIGGYVNRGSLDSCSYGKYIFADQKNGFFVATEEGGHWNWKRVGWACGSGTPRPCDGTISSIDSFGEDNEGNVYVLSRKLYRVVSQSLCPSLSCSARSNTAPVATRATQTRGTSSQGASQTRPSQSAARSSQGSQGSSQSDPSLGAESPANSWAPWIPLALACAFFFQ